MHEQELVLLKDIKIRTARKSLVCYADLFIKELILLILNNYSVSAHKLKDLVQAGSACA